MIKLFDHVFSPVRDNDLDATLARFERAGFLINPKKVRHPCGRLTGFVQLTESYLEFLSVIDEAEFAREATLVDRFFRTNPHPYGIGALTTKARAIHRALSPHFPEMPPVTSRAPVGREKPAWTFCSMSPRAFSGAFVFALQYHGRRRVKPKLQHGQNTIFALGGFTFCSTEPERAQSTWKRTLERVARVTATEAKLRHGVQEVEWISLDEYRQRTRQPYRGGPEHLGSIAGIKLLCADIAEACRWLAGGGFQCVSKSETTAFFEPDPNTGYTFELFQQNPARFLSSLGGERRRDRRDGGPRVRGKATS